MAARAVFVFRVSSYSNVVVVVVVVVARLATGKYRDVYDRTIITIK